MNTVLYKALMKKTQTGYIRFQLNKNTSNAITSATIVEISDLFKELTGVSKKELKNQSLNDLISNHGDQLKWLEKFEEAIFAGETVSFEQHVETTDKWFTFEITFPDAESCFVIIEDNSARKASEKALKDANGRVDLQRQAVADLLLHEAIVSGDMDQAVPFITKLLSKTIGVARASIWIFNDEQSEMSCISLYERDGDKHSDGLVLYRKDFPKYFEVMCTDTRINAVNAQTDPATSEFTEIYLKPLNIHAMLDAGIMINGKAKGVVCLENTESIREWTVDEEAFASTAAAVISQIILNEERSKTERELQESKVQLEALLADQMEQQKLREEQEKMLAELSTPVTQLWDGILLLPLVGIMDSKRAQDIMTTMLTKISTTQAKVFILDISGIAVVDTAVANYLIKMTKATRLMGCMCIISGIASSVAQTIVELGINIEEIETTGNMQDALKTALQVTDASINN